MDAKRGCSMLVLLGALLAPLAQADWRNELPGARPVGSGDFTWFGFTLYRANLWSAGSHADFSTPFALELVYQQDISRDDLVEASEEEILRLSNPPPDPATLARWRAEMQAAFVDVQPGRRITGVYLPGRGCRFYVDGRLSRDIADPAFARAFFDIWLAPGTRKPELRRALLGLDRTGGEG